MNWQRRLRAECQSSGLPPRALAASLLEEGLKARRFPGIVHMDGTAGRRACLSGGPDVWQVIRALREIPTDQYDPVETVCIEADLHERQVNLAIQYCEAYPDEVEAMIAKDAAAIHLIDTMIAERDAALAQADQSDISEKHDLDSGLSL